MRMMRAAKRWILQRGNPWGLGKRKKDGHVLPKADTMLVLNEQRITLMDWQRSPGAYFAYWIVRANIYGAQREKDNDGDHLALRYTYHFKSMTVRRTSTDYDARTSWGNTVLMFNRYVNDTIRSAPGDTQQRAGALQRVRRLEHAPLDERANKDREWLMAWLLDAPELDRARYCIDTLGPEWKLDYRHAAEIETQLLFASTTPWLEAPDTGKNDIAAYRAGVLSMLNTYQAILREDPEARQPALDSLLEKQRQDALDEYLSARPFIDDPARCAEGP